MKLSKKSLLIIGIIFLMIFGLSSAVLFKLESGNSDARKFFQNDKKIDVNLIGLPGKAIGVKDPKWEEENIFINSNIFTLLGKGYEIKNFHKIAREQNPNPVKVVIFGDGYTWGNSNPDRYSTVTALVQDELDRQLGPNVIEVTVISTNAASTFNHYDYFKANSIAKYKPDLVIYDYFDNDINPGFNESLICRSETQLHCTESKANPAEFDPAYQDCLHGEGDSKSRLYGRFKFIAPKTVKNKLTVYCKPLYEKSFKNKYDWLKVQNFPYKSPYIKLWEFAVKGLRESLRPYPSAVVKLIPFAPTMEDEKKMLGVFKASGWDLVPMSSTIKYFTDNLSNPDFVSNIQIDPGVGYPSSVLNNLYAKDISKYIIGKIDPKLLKRAKDSVTGIRVEEPLVKFTMPVFDLTNTSLNANESRLIFNKKAAPLIQQDPDQKADARFQYNNCYNLGSSNFLFTLNKGIQGGKFKITGLPKGEDTEVGVYYYDSIRKKVFLPFGRYSEGKIMELPKTTLDFTIALIFPKYSQGCPVDQDISAPDFDIKLTYLG